jgi:2-oxoacid:acceptor oxidoreductase delta subunit (pyruvate/2-ketoisovalerate family)
VRGVTRHPGGAVVRDETQRARTGGWRTEGRPSADVARCVNCLLCWLYCPDAAVRLDGTTFVGFDYDVCKGCQICVEMCPTQAIAMEAEDDGAR